LAAQHHFIDDIGLVVWPDGTSGGNYQFQHALYQQVLYEQVGTVRRMQLHRRIGARLEGGYESRVREVAAPLAVHFERGGETYRAAHYWQQAGDNAAGRNVYPEAIAALRRGLALLAALPGSPERTQHELALQLILGRLLMAAQGMAAAEAGDVYTRAHMLCQQLGETRQLFQVLSGLAVFHSAQARLHTSAELVQQLFDLAQRLGDSFLVRDSHILMGAVALYRGNLVAARAHLEQSLELSTPEQPSTPIFAAGLHPRVASLVWLGRAMWMLGYADQAQQRSKDAVALAQRMEHTPSLAYAEYFATMLYQHRQDARGTSAHAEALMTIADEQGFALRFEQGRILRGWGLAMCGEVAAGVAQIRQGLAALEGIGPKLAQPYHLTLLAEAYDQAGRPEIGLQVLAEALTLLEATEERWWEAELHRLKGALLLHLPIPDLPQAEACFQQALAVACSQQAKGLELRAALSLSGLWQQQGQPQAARALLAPICGWFTEGFDTPDLQAARALLRELRRS
jgi:predicted ATPase